MKATQINGYGGKDAISVNPAVPKPEPGEGQVLVAVEAAGVNPFDIKVREGAVPLPEGTDFPATLGGDVAGVVAGLGDGVIGYEIGQAVYGQAGALSGQGSFAEFTVVKAGQLAPRPKGVDSITAAALPLVGVSAYQALVDHMGLQAGQRILIHGGAGGIGSMAIQLAKHLGAYVITTARAEDHDFTKQLGADEMIDYQTQDFSRLASDLDAVFDTVGGETNVKSYTVLKPGGTLVSMVAPPNDKLADKYKINYISQFTRTTAERLAKLAELTEQGVLKVNIDKVFPLKETAEALEYLKTGHPRGKVVIKVKD